MFKFLIWMPLSFIHRLAYHIPQSESVTIRGEIIMIIVIISGFMFIFIKHYKNMPIQIYWKFYHQKMKIFR